MGSKLKTKPLFVVATDKSPKNLYWVSKWNSGTEGAEGVYTSKRIREEDLISVILENVVIPTNLSEYTNDVGFITSSSLPTNLSDLSNDVGYITSAGVPANVSAFTNDAGYVTSDTNFANTNGLTFTSNKTHELAGYVLTLNDANLKLTPLADTSAHYPLRVTNAADTEDVLYVRADRFLFYTGEVFSHQTSEFQGSYNLKGSGSSRINLQNNVNNGMSFFSNSGQGQITHVSGFLQYTLRSGLTGAGNVELDAITWAYEDGGVGVTNLVARFKKANGEVFKATIAGVYEP